MSYVIFLYADDLIQWTTGDVTGNFGLGGVPAQVGLNAGDGVNFERHVYSFTPDVINITSSRVPEDRVRVDGMVVYRVDSQGPIVCINNNEGKHTVKGESQ